MPKLPRLPKPQPGQRLNEWINPWIEAMNEALDKLELGEPDVDDD